MAGTTQGIGTKWIDGVYDENDYRARCATKWFVLIELPIIPLKRAVLLPTSRVTERHAGGSSEKTEYEVLETRWLHLTETLFVYLWRWLIAMPWAVLGLPGSFVGAIYASIKLFNQSSGILGGMLPLWLDYVLGIVTFFVVLIPCLMLWATVMLRIRKVECFVLSLTDNGVEVASRLDDD